MGHSGGMGSMMTNQRIRLADAAGRLVTDTADMQAGGELSADDLIDAQPIRVDGQVVGYLLAEGGMGYSSSDETLLTGRISRAAIVAGLIAGGLSLLMALLLAYQLSRPVRALTQAANRLGSGDLSQRVRVGGGSELAMLGQTFNHMAASLEDAEQSRRDMTADIAHELRNPLAVQRANLEALQDGVYPLTAENLEPVLEQNLLLTRLVEDLRTLALADSGQLSLERTETEIIALTKRLVERFKSQAAARSINLDLKLSGSSDVPVLCHVDPMRIEQILNNLFSNALRYTPDGGRVNILLSVRLKDIELSVRDNGPGIPEEALPHLFERFYRADRSRSRSEGGTGLGLAIARQLAKAHDGELKAENHPAGGAVFTLILPRGSHENQ
jgi:signal transduction histidine kinase